MRRRLDRAALAWGAVFTVVGVAFFLQELGVWRATAEVVLPVLLIVMGLAFALSAIGREHPRP